MNKFLFLFSFTLLINSCSNPIKNNEAKVVVEPGTEVPDTVATMTDFNKIPGDNNTEQTSITVDNSKTEKDLLGFWVGYFEQDEEKMGRKKSISVDEGFQWNKENKINISIDQINDTLVIGHSVVAGNDRPFKGIVKKKMNKYGRVVSYTFSVKEPGDDKYDGEFNFTIIHGEMKGKWVAYKDINIRYREYNLTKKSFKYDPDIVLERNKRFIDWTKSISEKVTFEDGDDTYDWIRSEYASATNLIYEINASNTLIERNDVANLQKGDLTIIRNTIYARHGYSFKNQPLRVFFDAQEWYIPVHADIRSNFTEMEKKNIELLLSFEKNASEYFDRFGRG